MGSDITRRTFLQQAAAAVAAPYIVPAAALGAEGRPAPSGRINVGMIGMGRQAVYVNLKQFLAMPDVQVVAVCDVDSWRLENAKKAVEDAYAKRAPAGTYNGCRSFGDFRELLARPDIDAVMISTPDHWHVPMAIAAMEAGKDVSLEKPITRSIGEGRRLCDTAKRTGRIFRVDSEFRTTKGARRACELVRSGKIGKIHTITVGVPAGDVGCPPQPDMPVPPELDYERWQGPAPRAPYTEKRVTAPHKYDRPGWMRHLYYCDGMITNWGTHLVNGALWCADLDRTGPVEIEGTGTRPPADSFWNVLIKFQIAYRFANGIRMTYSMDKPYYKIEGSEGWVWADFSTVKAEPASLLETVLGPDAAFQLPPARSDKQDFIDCVKSRKETLEPAEVGHRVTSCLHLGHIAIELGQKLQWDPAKERFLGNDAANAMIDKRILEPRRG